MEENKTKAVLEAEKMLEVIERDPQANNINNIEGWIKPIFAIAIGQVVLESFAKSLKESDGNKHM